MMVNFLTGWSLHNNTQLHILVKVPSIGWCSHLASFLFGITRVKRAFTLHVQEILVHDSVVVYIFVYVFVCTTLYTLHLSGSENICDAILILNEVSKAAHVLLMKDLIKRHLSLADEFIWLS